MKKKIVASLGFIILVISLAASIAGKKPSPVPAAGLQTIPTPVISPNIPADVDPAATGAFRIDLFDDYSWRVFLALVWPIKDGQRGTADPSKHLGDPGPLVFETFKADWEMFPPNSSAPDGDWNTMGNPLPCNTPPTLNIGDMALVSTTKFGPLGNLGQAGPQGSITGPIVAQNQTYVRYLTGFNEIEFDKIIDDTLWLASHLDSLTQVTFPNGAIDVKSSWIEMKGIAHPERYHTRVAWVFDAATNTCRQDTFGLVGLHIVQKTPSRPQWIWTSFEQVDNIPQQGSQAPFAFNKGDGVPFSQSKPLPFPPTFPVPPPFNIERVKPINASTQTTNAAYQQAIRNNGNSVWQFYQLVMTQWPVPANTPANDGSVTHSFPGVGAATTFSNVTMETFEQKAIQTGCMNCHTSTRLATDFLWSLKVNAFESAMASRQLKAKRLGLKKARPVVDPSIERLKSLLQTIKQQH